MRSATLGASRTRLAGLFLLVVVALLCVLCPSVAAFPFSKQSAVTELTPATLSSFVNTHKPVVVLFYAPWCGHCKKLHPEYERFAASVKGTMRVGALDADQYSSVGQQYGVRGFPTIKYWKMGTKSIASPQDYQGQRTAGALQAFMVSDISAAGVKLATTTEVLKQAARDAPHRKVGVLFSAKDKVPPMLSVMALSPKLKDFPLYFAGGSAPDKGVAQSFQVAQLPTVGILQYTPATPTAAESFELVRYPKGTIGYEPIAHFFVDCVEKECSGGGGVDAAAAAAGEKTEGEGRHGGHHHQHHKGGVHGHRQPSVALPVEPVEFTARTIENFCSPRALRLNGRAPLCVVSLTEHVSLTAQHQQFQNDPLLFFDATKQRGAVVQQFQRDFNVALDADEAVDEGAVLVMRQGHPGRLRHVLLKGMLSDSELQNALQKILNGELRLGNTNTQVEEAEEARAD